ncbi:MAG TPA: DoxX family protein [Candidatus Acidoferrum sp.]|nr:DoxX family protein [Candidatus Acidoferrum sp.]
MNAYLARYSIPLLRWTLGLVVILESCQFVLSESAAHFLAKAGLPAWIRPVLGGAESAAAILFLVPVTSLIGGYVLLVVFGMAALVHLLHGQFRVEGLVLYAVAVLVCITYTENRTGEALHDRT